MELISYINEALSAKFLCSSSDVEMIIAMISYLFLINFILMGFEILFNSHTSSLRNTFLFARYGELKDGIKNLLMSRTGFRIVSIIATAVIIALILKMFGISPFESQIGLCGNTLTRQASGHIPGAGSRASNSRVVEVAGIAVIMGLALAYKRNQSIAKRMQEQGNQTKCEFYMNKQQIIQRKMDRVIEDYYNIHKSPESDS